jgi:hypothetical protein
VKSDNLEIARFLHLKSEIRNLKLDHELHRCLAWQSTRRKEPIISGDSINLERELVASPKCFPRLPRASTFPDRYCAPALLLRQTTRKLGAAESRADFIHKLRIVLKELNETNSWLEQIVANEIFSREKMGKLIAENQELCWIVAASIKTARGSQSSI